MDGAWLAAAHFASAAAMLVVAALLLWVDAGSRPGRALVALLVLRAASVVVSPLAELTYPHDAGSGAAFATMNLYLHVAIAGCIAWLISEYPTRSPWQARALIAAFVLAAEIALIYDDCWAVCSTAGGIARGPLFPLTQALTVGVAVGAVWMFVAAHRMPTGTRRTSTLLLGIGFGIESALQGGTRLSTILAGGDPVPLLLAFFVACVFVVVTRARTRRLGLLAFIAAFMSAFVGNRVGGAGILDAGLLLIGAWRLAFPVLAAYAIARHRLFDLDLRMRIAAQRATIGAIFAGVFFIVTEGTAYILGSQFGMLAGIVAVGALVPAMGPLRRAAERISQVLPGDAAPPRDLPIERRREIYHEFALQAWRDGVLAREERMFLDQLRERLALPADDALRLESEASRTTQGG